MAALIHFARSVIGLVGQETCIAMSASGAYPIGVTYADLTGDRDGYTRR
jgi:hypothetical protein